MLGVLWSFFEMSNGAVPNLVVCPMLLYLFNIIDVARWLGAL